jgi:dihydrofolate reductase
MNKIILFNLMTVDGFFEGPNKEIDWHNVDSEFNDFAVKQLGNASCLIFGRLTYELMANYWPTPTALSTDPAVAEKMNSIPRSFLQERWIKQNGITRDWSKEILNRNVKN